MAIHMMLTVDTMIPTENGIAGIVSMMDTITVILMLLLLLISGLLVQFLQRFLQMLLLNRTNGSI